jgi:hypothetical protein
MPQVSENVSRRSHSQAKTYDVQDFMTIRPNKTKIVLGCKYCVSRARVKSILLHYLIELRNISVTIAKIDKRNIMA